MSVAKGAADFFTTTLTLNVVNGLLSTAFDRLLLWLTQTDAHKLSPQIVDNFKTKK